jgi:hypothetical protein
MYVSIKKQSVPVYDYQDKYTPWQPEISRYIQWSSSMNSTLIKDKLDNICQTVFASYEYLKDALEEIPNNETYREYTPEARATKIAQKYAPLVKKVISPLAQAESTITKTLEQTNQWILQVSEPDNPEGMDAILLELKQQEIRSLLRNLQNINRYRLVTNKLQDKDLSFLQAVMNSPDSLMEANQIATLRQDYARLHYAWLFTMKDHFGKMLSAAQFLKKGVAVALERLLSQYRLDLSDFDLN